MSCRPVSRRSVELGFWFPAVAVLATVAALIPSAGLARSGAGAVPRPAGGTQRLARAVASQDWPAYLFSSHHPSATTGSATITLGNAGSLTAAWKFQEQPPTGTGQPPGGFSASPTVADGMVFIGSQTGDLYALQESTGQLVWKKTLDYEQVGNNGNCKNVRGIVGTATVAADPQTGKPTVYIPGARYLYALDAATGAQDWKSLVGPAGSATVVGAYFNYASPTVQNGLVYEGVSSSCDLPLVRGGVQAFSQQTGSLQHTIWTDPAGQVGASVWSSEATTNPWVYVTTGDPKPTGTQQYYGNSFLRLNSTTLALRDSWQLKLQAPDLDFGSSPTLFDGTVNGVSTSLVGACSKNGRYYALRRSALGRGPVWSVRVGAADHTGQGECLASAVWNSQASALYLAGNTTSINGNTYDGSVREVNPGTGTTGWATGLSCEVIGTPALDAATGVLAVATWAKPCLNGSPHVYLLNAATGAILGTLPLNVGGFAQPVFAGPYLLVADESGQVVAYSPAAGHVRCTGWCHARHRQTRVPPIPAP